jgi:hypothetical protein
MLKMLKRLLVATINEMNNVRRIAHWLAPFELNASHQTSTPEESIEFAEANAKSLPARAGVTDRMVALTVLVAQQMVSLPRFNRNTDSPEYLKVVYIMALMGSLTNPNRVCRVSAFGKGSWISG